MIQLPSRSFVLGTLVFLAMAGLGSVVVLIVLAATVLVGLICGFALRRLANRQA